VSAVLASGARIVATPKPGGPTLTWTSADGSTVLTTTLKAVRD
jgi:hypothetical protein